MEDTRQYLYSILAFLLLALAINLLSLRRRARRRNIPPAPSLPLPIIGHLHLLKRPLNRTFLGISERWGPVFSLKLGNRLAVVVTSASAAGECFGKNDVVFANRPRFNSLRRYTYNYTTITTTSFGDHWRNLRRLTTLEILSTTRLNAFLGIRKEEINLMMRQLHRDSAEPRPDGFAKVKLRAALSELSFNIIMRMMAGKRYHAGDAHYEEGMEFWENVREITQFGGLSNPGDFLPFSRWIDYKGSNKKLAKLSGKADAFVQALIDEHRSNGSGLERKNTMIDHLLSLQQSDPEYYTDEIIKGLVLVMLIAGTDTTSLTIEWAISLMLDHPHVLKKAKAELDIHVKQDRLIDESNLSNLRYLQGVILETLRLYPPAPLLAAHMSSEDCTVGGYDIPRDTILLVNAWAIQRDPELWEDPNHFKPERFEGGGEEGSNGNKLMPFGMGRRSCPGAGMAHRVMGLTLGSLFQCFEWESVSETPMDLTGMSGNLMPKTVPLEAMCKAREIMSKVIAEDVNTNGIRERL